MQAFTREGLPWNEGLRQLLINYRGNPQRRQQVTRRTHVRPCLPATSSGCIAHHRKDNNFGCFPCPTSPRSTTSFKHTTLKRGAEVLIRDSRTTSGKGQATWCLHPYTIQHRNDKTYTLVQSDGTPNSQIKRHSRDIKRFFRPDDFPEQKYHHFQNNSSSASKRRRAWPSRHTRISLGAALSVA